MRLNDNHTALERIKEKLINRGTDFSLRPVDKITVRSEERRVGKEC